MKSSFFYVLSPFLYFALSIRFRQLQSGKKKKIMFPLIFNWRNKQGSQFSIMYYVNENIKNTKRIFPQQGRYAYKRYDMNENPGPSQSFCRFSPQGNHARIFVRLSRAWPFSKQIRFFCRGKLRQCPYDKRFRHGDTISSRNFRRNEKRSCNRLSFLWNVWGKL